MSDQDLQFKITTVAELGALRDLEKDLQKAVVSARALGNTKLAGEKEEELKRIQGQLAQFGFGERFEAQLKSVVGKIPVLGEVVEGLNGSFGILAKGAVAGAAALELAKKSIEAFAEKETEVAKLNQALANSGQYSEEASAQVQELADKFEELTGIDDGKFINVARTLLQFGANRDNLEQYTQAVVNLAGLLGGDVEQAAFLFGKAMQGSTEMLSRYGIHVDSALSKTQQLEQIMQQAAQRGGGQLLATQGTLGRGFTDLGISTGKWFTGLGSIIAQTGILQRGLGALAEVIRFVSFSDVVGPAKEFQNSLDGIAESAEETAKKLDAAKTAGEALAKTNLDEITAAAEAAAKKFDALTAAIQRSESANIAIRQAQTAVDLAKIDEDEAADKINPGEAARRRFDAKKAGDEREVTAKIDSIQAQMKVETDKVEQARFNTAVVRINRDQTQGKIDENKGIATDAQTQLDSNRDNRSEERARQSAEIAALKKKLARLTERPLGDNLDLAVLFNDPVYQRKQRLKQPEIEATRKALAEAESKASSSDKTYTDEQTALRTKLAAANAEIARLQPQADSYNTDLTKKEGEEKTTKTASETKLADLDSQLGTVTTVYGLKQEAETIGHEKVQREADKKTGEEQANAGILGRIRTEAVVGDRFAVNTGEAARKSGDKELEQAALTFHQASQAMENPEAGVEQAKAFQETGNALVKYLAAHKQKNDSMEQALKTLATQVAGLTSTRNQ